MVDEFEEDDPVRRAEGRVGRVLKDKWTLVQLIGVGGMAAVYEAEHRNGKRVAVKVLHPELSIDRTLRARFLREGYAANAVKHPGVVVVDDDDVIPGDGAAFLVMELLDGESIDARARRKGGTLPATEVLSIADQVLDVLAAAHDKGIVHRDIKPENLFLTREGVVKVLDFGIARLGNTGATGWKTGTGVAMGTPGFMAPEQARGRWEDVDARSDLWSVGATMFALLTGKSVHAAESPSEALVKAITEAAPAIGTVLPALPARVAAVVDVSLAYERVNRPPDARSMQAEVRAAFAALGSDPGVQGLPPAVRPSVLPERPVQPEPPAAPSPPVAAARDRAMTTARGLTTSHTPEPRVGRRTIVVVGAALGVAALAAIAFATRTSEPIAQEPATANPTPPPVDRPAATPVEPPAPVVAPAGSVPVAPTASASASSSAEPKTKRPRSPPPAQPRKSVPTVDPRDLRR